MLEPVMSVITISTGTGGFSGIARSSSRIRTTTFSIPRLRVAGARRWEMRPARERSRTTAGATQIVMRFHWSRRFGSRRPSSMRSARVAS
jgi:hypothetical protein